MSSTAISIENIGKKYIINHQSPERYTTLRDVVAHKAKKITKNILSPFRKIESDSSKEAFWALKDISFEVNQGEVIGIIGRNGAGKTTLLKILSRITEPTTGRFRIKGRVASLLEVGTGFHPELTGRENVFLNGAILGMTRQEIRKKFDEIVAFAEVEKFLDTPVKRYSSGMHVRLAFAVAAHLEPEILIVDEVLAVGDAFFQKKCLGKMQKVGQEGRTVLFVSHNMAAIQSLCQQVILLVAGKLTMRGTVDEVMSSYMSDRKDNSIIDINLLPRGGGLGKDARIFNACILNKNNEKTSELRFHEPFSILVECRGLNDIKNVRFDVSIHTLYGVKIIALISKDIFDLEIDKVVRGTVHIDGLSLTPGTYSLRVALRLPIMNMADSILDILHFTVTNFAMETDIIPLSNEVGDKGIIQLPDLRWEILSDGVPNL